jgi:hypothetical protein
MPASQAGRRGFESRLPLHKSITYGKSPEHASRTRYDPKEMPLAECQRGILEFTAKGGLVAANRSFRAQFNGGYLDARWAE